jgi:ribosomal-protein-alanine N-acetyltransferase
LPGDVNEIFFLRSNEQVLQYIDKEPADSLEDAIMFIEKINNQEQKNECVNWALVPKGENRLIGIICFWNIEQDRDKAEVGYSMHPHYYGAGLMQEAMAAILEYGFNTMRLKLVEAITNKNNQRSVKLLERNNFKRDAVQEQLRVGEGKEEPEYATIYSLKS